MGRKPTVPKRYTVVQHSGFGYAGDETWEQGLEIRSVDTKAEQDLVRKADGVLFDTYHEADEFIERAMYPENYQGLIPKAQGEFSDKEIDQLRIYIPKVQVIG